MNQNPWLSAPRADLPDDESMSKADDRQYRTALEVCRRMAEKTSNNLEKNAWLNMAESWRLLIICHSHPINEDFNAATEPLARAKFGRYLQACRAIHAVAGRGASRLLALLRRY